MRTPWSSERGPFWFCDDAIAFEIVAMDQNEVAIARREGSIAVFDDAIALKDVALRRNEDARALREGGGSVFDDAIAFGMVAPRRNGGAIALRERPFRFLASIRLPVKRRFHLSAVEQQPDVPGIGVLAAQLETVADHLNADVVAAGTLIDALLHLGRGVTGGSVPFLTRAVPARNLGPTSCNPYRQGNRRKPAPQSDESSPSDASLRCPEPPVPTAEPSTIQARVRVANL